MGLPRCTVSAGIEGEGLFALDNVKSGSRIIEYTGNIISGRNRQRMERAIDYRAISPDVLVYVPPEKAVIDPRGISNGVRKVNHH